MTGPDWRWFDHEDGDDSSRQTQCKRCGSEDVEWVETDSGWRLVDPDTGKLHRCEITFDPVDND